MYSFGGYLTFSVLTLGDENGVFPNETTPTVPPTPVANTQKAEISFVKEWLKGTSS
jgi:hypothetical protein